MKNIIKTITGAAVVAAFTTVPAISAEPIVGKWQRNDGTMIQFAGAGPRYCGKVLNGKYSGKSIGCLSGKNGKYNGSITVLSEGKTYTGKASVRGNTMKLSGCVLKVLCKSENLKRR